MLRKSAPYLLTLVLLLTAGAGESAAQQVAAGALLSPKGSGVALRLDRGALLYDLAFTADLYGVLRHSDGKPGYAFSFYCNPVLYDHQLGSDVGLRIFAGPGFSAGWLADRDGGGFGFTGALNADFGLSFDFARQMSATVGLSTALGLHAAANGPEGTMVRFYRNGLIRTLYPEARILYRFNEGKRPLNNGINRNKSITYGVETSLWALLYAVRDVDFRVEDGYRVHDRMREMPGRVAGEVLAFVGYDFSPAFNLSLYAGYSGEYTDTRMFPISLRSTVYALRKGQTGGFVGFLDGGVALSEKHDMKMGIVAKAGIGWRFFVGGGWALDLMASVRAGFLHPYLYDPLSGHRISDEDIFRNNATVISPGISIALSL